MNLLLWILQICATLLFGTSGVMKVFLFDNVTRDVPSFGALPRQVWFVLGIVELVCCAGLVLPGALHWQPGLTALAALVLAVESPVLVWVHVKYRELTPILLTGGLGVLMAFIAYARFALVPLA